jgi:NAD(P)-dependent dehydrogenase (short-subunit alcohol dehydrogenase family)
MKRVVVTAGAAGIGLQIAQNYLAAGARVAVCDVDVGALDAFRAAHPDALAMQADVTDEADMNAFFSTCDEHLGGVDVMVSTAGIGGPAALIEDLDYSDWKATLSITLDGTFLSARWAAKHMRAQKSGLIVLLSSTAGLFGYPYRSAYATAKWGIVGLTKTLAMEMGGDGIRVNCICPGAVEGDRMDRVVANEARARGVSEQVVRDDYVSAVSLKTWVTAEDIANMVHFLDSPAGVKISGQALAVDGHTESIS